MFISYFRLDLVLNRNRSILGTWGNIAQVYNVFKAAISIFHACGRGEQTTVAKQCSLGFAKN